MFSACFHAKTRRRKVNQEFLRIIQGVLLCVFASLRENLFMTENELSRIVVDSAFNIHRDLGPGLFESVYEAIMAYELRKRGCTVLRPSTENSF